MDNKEEKEELRKEKIEKKIEVHDQKVEEQKEEVKKEFKGFWYDFKVFFKELLNIKVGTDKELTAQTIREGIVMKGHTAWILVFSIIVASIGLNISSTAVVIGAMLISPLMGPILGIGFSVGINDIDTLKTSLINFAVTVGISLITSFLFFSIPLFQHETPELIARTRPDVRDVLIAISGGLALIIALSRPTPQFNTIAGVAIATALMPPLCTAGYGLAIGNLDYFGGALFLFTINSIFIALASFAIIKYLRFPMVRYIDQAKRKRIARLAMIVATIIFLLSIQLFYQLFLEERFKAKANTFIAELKEEGVDIIGLNDESIDYDNNVIKLFIFGNNYDSADIKRWEKRMDKMDLTDTKLEILQSQEGSRIRNDINEIKEMYINNHKLLSAKDVTISQKDKLIKELENDLRKYYKNEIPVNSISKEIKINYEHIKRINFAEEFSTNFKKVDTTYYIGVQWDKKIAEKEKRNQEKKLKKWLKTRLFIKNLVVREVE
ncbi:MAG: hypothetical protein DSY82_06115 [Flavobacteriia bacterium]|nr:MAG: hypothetical protein DSY82_06115 [Flavobacteriia bacterium]